MVLAPANPTLTEYERAGLDQAPMPARAARSEAASPPRQRDAFLDVVRGVATLRVVVWHMYGFAVISYFVAAIPAMFFVSGSLFGASLMRRPWRTVVLDRFRRVLIPLWLFAASAWVLMLTTVGTGAVRIPWARVAPWVFPLVDPHGLGALGAWVASPLWFLRMLTWLLLLSPVILWGITRYGGRVVVLGPLLVLACEWAGREHSVHVASIPRLWWYVGEVGLYGTFFAVGLLHCRTQFRAVSVRHWVLMAVAFGTLAAGWRLTQPVPDGIVNNAQPLHMLIGAMWLSIAFAARGPITRFAARPRPHHAVTALSRRSFTIYLWHCLVIYAVLQFLEQHGSPVSWINDAVYPILVVIGLAAVTVAVGWIEDVAAGRRPSLAPVSIGSARNMMVVSIVVVLTIATALVAIEPWNTARAGSHAVADVYTPRLPSQQPPLPSFVPEDLSKPAVPVATGGTIARLPAAMSTLMTTFQQAQHAPGVAIAARSFTNGLTWAGAVGDTLEGAPMAVDDQIDIASVTKMFTATLVMQAVDQGLIDLDAPLPHLDAVPWFPYTDVLTPRLLLEHRSGLVDYRDTDVWHIEPAWVTTPSDAVAASGSAPLLFEPGTQVGYSSVNYLVLGLLLEQVTGRSYDDLLTEDLLVPLGLTQTTHAESEPGTPRGGAAGIESTLPDLLGAADGLLKRHASISSGSWAAMNTLDVFTGVGAGIAGYCPCTVAADGTHKFFALGFTGSSTFVVYVPTLDIAVAIQVGDDLWTDPGRFAATTDLIHELATTLAAVR